MPKIGMEQIRRAQLIEATFEAVHLYGFAGATLGRVSELAGVSTGIISHYFGGKDELLEASMRELLRKLGDSAAAKNLADKSPKARILAIIDGNFAIEQVTPRAVTIWLAFWGQALHTPALHRLQRINLRRLRSNLRYWLGEILPRTKARETADGLSALIDGLWLRGAFQDGGIDVEQARRLCREYLELQLAAAGRPAN